MNNDYFKYNRQLKQCCTLGWLALGVLGCHSCLALGSLSPSSTCALKQGPKSGGQRLILYNGYSVLMPKDAYTNLVIFKGKTQIASIALRKEMEGWLHKGAVWSDAAKANDMLYMEMQGAGFMPILQDVIPLSDRLLAILDWQDQAGSGQPVKAQHLVQIMIGPHPAVKLLRDLPMGEEVKYALPPPRLFAYGKLLLLFSGAGYAQNEKGRLQTITPDGKVVTTLVTLPGALTPTAFQKQYLLQLKDNSYGIAQPFWTYDLHAKLLRHRLERVPVAQDAPRIPMTPAERLRNAIADNDLQKVQTMLAQGVPADADTLVQACEGLTNTEIIQLLLDKGAPVNGKNQYGKTPLFAAVNRTTPDDQTSLLRNITLLVEHGADLRTTDQEGNSLERAVFRHLDQVARLLLKHRADPNPVGPLKLTPLHVAVLVDDGARVQTLIHSGADVNAEDISGETPLFFAASANALEAAQALLTAGADPNSFYINNGFRFSPLYEAIRVAAPDMALLMVAHGADVNAPGPYQETSLVMALDMSDWRERDRPEQKAQQTFTARKDALIEALLQKGANINAVSRKIFSPLSSAMQQFSSTKGRNWFKELLERGADPNTRLYAGRTILFSTIDPRRHDIDLPLQLLSHGSDVNIADEGGVTPLLEAVSQQDFQLARLLIEHGAKVECHDRVHKTPLLWASYYGEIDLLKLLIEKGANLRAQDDLGQNALALARKGGKAAAVTYLQNKGLR